MNLSRPNGAGKTKKFCGNFVTSGPGIFLMLVLTLFTGIGISGWLKHPEEGFDLVPLLWPGLLFYFGVGTSLYYFTLSDDSLEIKNHVFPWFGREYRLDEIESVGFELPLKRSEALRVWKKDGSRSWAYSAGSLRKRHWQALKKALHERNIPVRS